MLQFFNDHNVKVTKHMTSNLLMACTIIGTSVFAYGFDTAVLDTIQAMTPFEKRFGEFDPKTKKYGFSADHLAYFNSFPLILFALGVIVASQIGERFGRKAVLIIMNCICMSGIAVCYTSKTFGQILAGRMIIQMHVGMEAWCVPMFTAEIVPAAVRGRMVAFYTFNHIFAAFIASIVTNKTSTYKDDSSWQIPIICMFIWPAIVLLGAILVPESPRWLLRRGQQEKASRNLQYLNGAVDGYSVEAEITLLNEALEASRMSKMGSWKELVRGPNLRRTMTGIVASACTQLTGQSFASQYGAIFLKSINVMDAFTATMIKRSFLVFGCLLVIFFIDRVGRRRFFLFFGSFSAASLLAMGALGSISPATLEVKKGIVAMAMFFPFCYITAFASTTTVVQAEVPHTTLRDKSMMVFWTFNNIFNFAATFTLPYLLKAPYANLQSRVGFIYGATSLLALIWGYFYLPDLKGRSLEEIDEMFEARVPARKSRGWKSSNAGAILTELENNPDGFTEAKLKQSEHLESSEKV
ncbi:uncharacterized protein E0L32_010389 [Thyridium curvatum]|uniref:Major facilitator superfamily (MFS) profile domain-containing protein n=1 Tax=Thyridium curvatum TaxID=1093900 RepID=A0A507ANK7_9PEZI|nr:uncharacterized protein E0L32_010389 [Thyridium curvatum]TPX07934.1 hypothetical protein E0L32_010389 [Thyridium curvatum]